MFAATHFSDPVAVEAWDNWFRWREAGVLRDVTIDSTWRRVAAAVASVEGAQAAAWAEQFFEAFSSWRLLPDARVLRLAGTAGGADSLAVPHAVLNAAAFIKFPGTALATFERERFAATSALAVRLLDDLLLARAAPAARARPRLGLVGLADALQRLRQAYGGAEGRQTARAIAAALAEGSLRGAVELAQQRGATDHDLAVLRAQWRRREMPVALVEAALRSGLRHFPLTVIEPQPQLSLLANNTSDALDPWLAPVRPGRQPGALGAADDAAEHSGMLAQIRLRSAMQPWIDAPIDYPLLSASEPDSDILRASERLSRDHGLPALDVRRAVGLELDGC